MSFLYLDTSALVKAFVKEVGSTDVLQLMATLPIAGTSIITKVEFAATLAKLERMKVLTNAHMAFAMELMSQQWDDFIRLHLTDIIVNEAISLTQTFPLRGYDAVQLASAIVWRDTLSQPVTFATFDKKLWQAAAETGLNPFPADLSPFLSTI